MRRFTALLAAMGLALSATAPCVRAADAPSSTQVEQMRASVKANDRDGVFALEHYYPTEFETLVADLASLQARGELNSQTIVKTMSPLLVKLRSHFADIANAPDVELLQIARTKVALLKALQGVDTQACTEAAEQGAVSPERGAKLVEQIQGAARKSRPLTDARARRRACPTRPNMPRYRRRTGTQFTRAMRPWGALPPGSKRPRRGRVSPHCRWRFAARPASRSTRPATCLTT